MGRTIDFIKNLAFESNQEKSWALPNFPIKKIIIMHNSGTLSGGTSGSYVTNSLIKRLRVEQSNEIMIDWKGEIPTDAEPYGMAALRIFNNVMDKTSNPNERWEIRLPAPIFPNTVGQGRLYLQFNTISNINDGDQTAYSGTITIKLEIEDGFGSVGYVVRNTKENIGTNTGDQNLYIDPTIKGFKCKAIIFYLEDNGTASNSVIDDFTIKRNGVDLYSGTFQQLKEDTDRLAQQSLGTGWALFVFKEPISINPSELQIEYNVPTAGTNVDLHYWIIQVK